MKQHSIVIKGMTLRDLPARIGEEVSYWENATRQCPNCGLMLKESTAKPLPYDQWLEINEEELYISAAESGADREYDYDAEAYAEAYYEEYCKEITHE